MRIMMSAAGSAVAPSIIKHLRWLGHYVIGHDCNPYGDSGANEMLRSPPVIDRLYPVFIRRQKFDLYIPFLDEELPYGWKGTSPMQTIDIFTNKITQHWAMKKAGLPVPAAINMYAAIVKGAHGRGGKEVHRAPKSDHLIQEFIDGDEYTIDVLTDLQGKFLFAVPRKRIATAGVSTIGRIACDPALVQLARKVTEKFKFAGPINIQVICDRDTGEPYIIEVNARLSGSCMFTVMAGWDILADVVRLHEGRAFIPPDNVKEITIRRHYVEEIV